jgi:hypothetical protein
MIYDVAVQALGAPNLATAAVEQTKGSIKKGKVTKLVFEVTNDGPQAGVFLLEPARKGKVKAKLLNNLLYLGAAETKEVTVYVRGGKGKSSVELKAEPALPSG